MKHAYGSLLTEARAYFETSLQRYDRCIKFHDISNCFIDNFKLHGRCWKWWVTVVARKLVGHISRTIAVRERGRDLTQSYDKRPYTHRKIQKATWQHKKTPPKTSITQRLRTDLGRQLEYQQLPNCSNNRPLVAFLLCSRIFRAISTKYHARWNH